MHHVVSTWFKLVVAILAHMYTLPPTNHPINEPPVPAFHRHRCYADDAFLISLLRDWGEGGGALLLLA